MQLPSAPYTELAKWNSSAIYRDQQFQIVGDVLKFLTTSKRTSSRPRMLATLCQALMWFHEACRDRTKLMAIVKFSACLDALATGREERGIRELLQARVGIMPDDTINANGVTMKKMVERIYREGRSRTVHGTNEIFDHDWSVVKLQAEALSRLGLISSLQWAFDNPTSDDPRQLSRL